MAIHDHTALGIATDILGLLAGLVVAFAGYRFLKSLAALAGLLTGFVCGLFFGTAFTGVLLVGLVVGVVGAILLAIIFVFAFRLAGAVLGGFLGLSVAAMLGLAGLVLVGLVIVGAVLGLIFNKAFIIVATATEGALLAARSATSLLDLAGATITNEVAVALVIAIGVAALGALVQWRHLRAHSK